MRGYALSTDIAPTVLERLGLPVPDEMSGEPIEATGEVDPGFVERLEDRLAAVGPRRGPVIGTNLLIWVGLAALAGVAFGRAWPARGAAPARGHGRLSAGGAAADRGAPAERARRAADRRDRLAGAGARHLAPGSPVRRAGDRRRRLRARLRGRRDRRLPLTALSLIGPNPALGVRFFGIGNELEATVVALVPIATGAALAAWAPRISPRGAALAFALTALVAVAAFAPGRFGADVGAAIGIPIGAAVAAAVCLGARRRRLLLVIAVPVVALAALAPPTSLLGGNAHLTRSVLEAGGLRPARRRRRAPPAALGGKLRPLRRHAVLWLCVLVIVAGIAQRRRIEAWFGGPAHGLGGLGGSGGRHRRRDARQRLGGPGADDRHGALCADRRARLGHAPASAQRPAWPPPQA